MTFKSVTSSFVDMLAFNRVTSSFIDALAFKRATSFFVHAPTFKDLLFQALDLPLQRNSYGT
jgi:hypothetical protein